MSVEYDGAVPEGLSSGLCAKGYFEEYTDAPGSIGEFEAMFYRDFGAAIPVRTLSAVYADVDPTTRHGVVITKDVAPDGANFLDGREPYSVAQAEASLEQYARLHGSNWNSPQVRSADWLAPRLESYTRARGLREILGNFDGPIGAGVPASVRDGERLLAAFKALPEICARHANFTLLHGDAHIGNLMLGAGGEPYLVDWQTVQRGPWFLDVGYHIGSALTVDDRRASERDLLERYLERLETAGGSRPTEEEAALGICCGLVYGFFMWAITLRVDPSITHQRLLRLGTAVADHDALSLVLSQ